MIFGVQWYYWLILLAAVVLAVFVWIKAINSGKERRERMKKEAEIWRRDYELREKYSVLTEEKLEECEDTELLHAVAMNIQVFLENATNMNEAFENLPQVKKNVYTLEYFDEDAKDSLSKFFKNNGAPLTPNIIEALNSVGAVDVLDFVSRIYPMFDPNSDVSVDYTVINRVDEEFKEFYSSPAFCRLVSKYIKDNIKIILG